jgi:hypothetical protein
MNRQCIERSFRENRSMKVAVAPETGRAALMPPPRRCATRRLPEGIRRPARRRRVPASAWATLSRRCDVSEADRFTSSSLFPRDPSFCKISAVATGGVQQRWSAERRGKRVILAEPPGPTLQRGTAGASAWSPRGSMYQESSSIGRRRSGADMTRSSVATSTAGSCPGSAEKPPSRQGRQGERGKGAVRASPPIPRFSWRPWRSWRFASPADFPQ